MRAACSEWTAAACLIIAVQLVRRGRNMLQKLCHAPPLAIIVTIIIIMLALGPISRAAKLAATAQETINYLPLSRELNSTSTTITPPTLSTVTSEKTSATFDDEPDDDNESQAPELKNYFKSGWNLKKLTELTKQVSEQLEQEDESKGNASNGREKMKKKRPRIVWQEAFIPSHVVEEIRAKNNMTINYDVSSGDPRIRLVVMYNKTTIFVTRHPNKFYYWKFAQTAASVVIFCMIVVGNVSILLRLKSCRRRRSNVNYFIAQLAIADLCVGCFNVTLDSMFRLKTSFTYGELACKASKYIPAVFLFSSTYLLVALSIDRWEAVVKPLAFTQNRNHGNYLVAGSWILAFISATPTTIETYIKEVQGLPQCYMNYEDLGWKIYMIYLTLSLLVIPALIIAVCYAQIVYTIWRKGQLVIQHGSARRLATLSEADKKEANGGAGISLSSSSSSSSATSSDESDVEVAEAGGIGLSATVTERSTCLQVETCAHRNNNNRLQHMEVSFKMDSDVDISQASGEEEEQFSSTDENELFGDHEDDDCDEEQVEFSRASSKERKADKLAARESSSSKRELEQVNGRQGKRGQEMVEDEAAGNKGGDSNITTLGRVVNDAITTDCLELAGRDATALRYAKSGQAQESSGANVNTNANDDNDHDRLRRRRRRRRLRARNIAERNNTGWLGNEMNKSEQQLRQSNCMAHQQHGSGVIPKARIKTVKMTLVIVAAFVLCWSPFCIINLCLVFGVLKSDNIFTVAISTLSESLAPLNSAVNPIIFWIFSSRRANQSAATSSDTRSSRRLTKTNKHPSNSSIRRHFCCLSPN